MLIRVRVTANARKVRIVKVGEASSEVRVDEKATGGAGQQEAFGDSVHALQGSKIKNLDFDGSKSRDKLLKVDL